MTPLRVMSVNIRYDNPKDGPNRWCFRKKSLATLIKEVNPDDSFDYIFIEGLVASKDNLEVLKKLRKNCKSSFKL